MSEPAKKLPRTWTVTMPQLTTSVEAITERGAKAQALLVLRRMSQHLMRAVPTEESTDKETR